MTFISLAGVRRRLRARALAPLVVIAAVAFAAPGVASGDSLTIAIGSDPVAGLASGVDYEYDTGGLPMHLIVVARSGGGPECQPTSVKDAALVGTQGATYLTPTPIDLNGRGGARLPFTFPTSGSWRVCAWLDRTPDDVAAAAVGNAQVRLPNASLAVTAQQVAPRPGGSDLQVRATGTIEAAADVLVTAVPATSACPPTFDEDTDPRAFDVVPTGVATRVTGAFDLTFHVRDLLSFGTWRVCAYLQDGTVAPAASATATTTIALMLKPTSLRAPRVKQVGGAMTCDGGRWRGQPKPKLAYAWLAGARKLSAKGKRLAITPALKAKAIRCRVTATNQAGKKTVTSRAVSAR